MRYSWWNGTERAVIARVSAGRRKRAAHDVRILLGADVGSACALLRVGDEESRVRAVGGQQHVTGSASARRLLGSPAEGQGSP